MSFSTTECVKESETDKAYHIFQNYSNIYEQGR